MEVHNKTNKIALFIAIFLFAIAIIPSLTNASYYREPFVKVYNNYANYFHESNNFFAYDPSFKGGATLAVGDLGRDGKAEIVTGPGVGGGPQVRVFDIEGNHVRDIWAYADNMKNGINVAMGDLDGNGTQEIITAPKEGGSPHVRIFDGWGNPQFNMGFFAYEYNFTGGVNIATCDVNGDGKDEIITGAGPGSTPHVRVFNSSGQWTGLDFRPFADSNRGGVTVACANVDGGSEEEIIMGIQSEGQTWIKVYKTDEAKTILGYFKGWPDGVTTGINVAGGDMDGDGFDEVVAAITGLGGPQVKVFEAYGYETHPGFFAYEEDFKGGVNIAVANIDSDSKAELFVAPSRPKPQGRTDLERYVMVDLSEQRLYAYKDGYLENTFLISSGLVGPTPTGSFYVRRKIYSVLYQGPDYYLPNTLYNMEFTPRYFLHGAYWHSNWGHPMSHGCVNISYPNAAWLYEWTSVGTPILIQY